MVTVSGDDSMDDNVRVEEMAHGRTVDERDAADACLDEVKALLGIRREWSSTYGHAEFLRDAADVIAHATSSLVSGEKVMWMTYDAEDGWDEHDDAASAIGAIHDILAEYRDRALSDWEWPEGVEHLRVGRFIETHRAVADVGDDECTEYSIKAITPEKPTPLPHPDIHVAVGPEAVDDVLAACPPPSIEGAG